MIDAIKIHALKSVKDLTVFCSNLNVFAGTNSSGKSTILQSLLIVSQIEATNKESSFNGELIKLGEFNEVRSKLLNKDNVEISLADDGNLSKFTISENVVSAEKNDSISNKISYKRRFYYIPFDRIGVAETYPKNTTKSKFGYKCDCALSYFESQKKETEPNPLDANLIKDPSDKTLSAQVNYWLDKILGVTLQTFDENPKGSYLTATYTSKEGMAYRPMNVGSGVSYLVTIIIVCLAAEKDSVIVIENPEIHLHPKAQALLMEFLYFIADSGRQLFVETHSDHIFNGIRAGVATQKMDAKKICVNFVTYDEKDGTKCEKIEIGKHGDIKNPQPDLFEQFDIDLNKMLGLF